MSTLEQAVIWTALPQGRVPGSESEVRVSVFVTPQLSVTPAGGTPPQLSGFTDWVNWPDTMLNKSGSGPIKFGVKVTGGNKPVTAEADLQVLRPDLWSAMFDPNVTRVDPYAIENFNSIPIRTFHAAAVHEYVQGLYGPLNAGSSEPLTFEPEEQGGVGGDARPDITRVGGGFGLPSPIEPGGLQSHVYSNLTARPVQFDDVLKFHEVPEEERAEAPKTAPVLDFHSAVSSLGSYPELLRYFGLVFPLTINLDDFGFIEYPGNIVQLTIEPQWTSSFGSRSIDVKPTTMTMFETFLPAPYGSDYNNSSSGAGAGFLLLGKKFNATTPQFSIVDVDVDGACESIDSSVSGLESTFETHAGSKLTVDLRLPSLRSSGPSLLWHDWGQEDRTVQKEGSLNLAALAAMQTKFQEEVKKFVETPQSASPPVVYSEHLTRGWRLDVGTQFFGQDRGESVSWDSLHWRLGDYVFGTGDGAATLNEATPIEGLVTPGVTHQPVAKDEAPKRLWIHESIARWDGWSLSAPRPGKHIKNDGTVSKEGEALNPVPENKDEYGNVNAQISALFSIPRAGQTISEPNGNGQEEEKVGSTGLPPLRFGRTYFYRARTVDLSGWSLPQSTSSSPGGPETIAATHYRWEPVRPPFVVPTAPLKVGEGALTIVIRDDGTGPVQPSARWLFPPKIHELKAEEHGAFDEDGVPRAGAEELISKYNDGSLGTLPGIKSDLPNSSGVENLVLPHPAAVPPGETPVTWLPDPPAAGLAIFGEGAPNRTLARGYDPVPGKEMPFVDLWAGKWPALLGKLLKVQAAKEPYFGFDGVDGRDPTDHYPWLATPEWSFSVGEHESSNLLTMTVVPGSVYALEISSAFPAPPAPGLLGELGSFGLWSWIEQAAGKPIFSAGPPIPVLNPIEVRALAAAGGQYQLTPSQTVMVIYAVLKPRRSPAFSSHRSFKRALESTAVTIEDTRYIIDPPSTSTVTYTATWTDPVDDPGNPENKPATETRTSSQGGLLLHVDTLYPPAVPPGSVTVSPTEAEKSPFGFIGFEGGYAEIGPKLYAEQRIGDTKHHLVTYTATAGGRFGEFFATTTLVTLGTTPTLIDKRGISVNNLKVMVPEVPAGGGTGVALPAVTVPATLYEVDGPGGMITLKSGATVQQAPAGKLPKEGNTVELEKTEVAVTYVPTDTLLGPSQELHVLSSATPPPVKIVKVAPAWSLSRRGSVDQYGGYTYEREGNTLRVYFERPWYATGPDELLGVVVAHDAPGPSLPSAIRADLVTTLGFDPISVTSHNGEQISQSQLTFVTNTKVPATEKSPEERTHATVTLLEESGENVYDVYPYKPQYDEENGLWFADITLGGRPSPPPGYFLRLSLVRYQPFSEFSPVSPVSLVTVAQPVANRTVEVKGEDPCYVNVRGPAYYGWRPPSGERDLYNPDAPHPISESGNPGSPITSTMVVEVQEQNDENGFGGDFAWATVEGFVSSLTPNLNGDTEIEWISTKGITLPKTDKPLRLRISELDFYGDGPLPKKIDTEQRRTFVCLIPFP